MLNWAIEHEIFTSVVNHLGPPCWIWQSDVNFFSSVEYRASAETKFRPSPDCCYKQTGLAQIGQIGPNLSSPFLLTSWGNNNNNQNWVEILFIRMPYFFDKAHPATLLFRLRLQDSYCTNQRETNTSNSGMARSFWGGAKSLAFFQYPRRQLCLWSQSSALHVELWHTNSASNLKIRMKLFHSTVHSPTFSAMCTASLRDFKAAVSARRFSITFSTLFYLTHKKYLFAIALRGSRHCLQTEHSSWQLLENLLRMDFKNYAF